MPMFFNPRTAMAATEEAYPALVGAYRRLMASAGIAHPAPIFVSNEHRLFSPAVAVVDSVRHAGDHMVFVEELAKMGDSPITRGILAHETGHLLTRENVSALDFQFSPIRSAIRSSKIERQMDRIGAVIAGAEDMLAARKWVGEEGSQIGRSALADTTILQRANKHLTGWMSNAGYALEFGSPKQQVRNIERGVSEGRGFVDKLVAEYNTARESALSHF